MSDSFDIIAIIQPKAGKADRVSSVPPKYHFSLLLYEINNLKVQELLKTTAEAVKTNEPGTLRYHLHRETKDDKPCFVMLET